MKQQRVPTGPPFDAEATAAWLNARPEDEPHSSEQVALWSDDWPLAKRTSAAFADPRAGDEFNEMWSYFAGVTRVDGDTITYWRGNNAKAEQGTCSRDEWNKMFAYGTIPGHSVLLHKRGRREDGCTSDTDAPCGSSACAAGCLFRGDKS